MADGEPEVGLIIADKYRLTRLIGRGGMGSVWEGEHTTLATRVAVKFIERSFVELDEVRDRFVNEARAAASLRSTHIVQVYDHGTDDRGRPYIVMELLRGEPLDARLEREGTLGLAEVQSLITQASRGLRKAHAAGIVHRDLKPENIFLAWDEDDRRDVVKLVDFGIAKFTDGSGISSATRTGAVLGTPHFMSPEQARGLKTVDARADIWSLGVIAYRCTTGRLPFDGEAVGDLLVRLCTQQPIPPSQHVPLPEEFDAWLQRSLAKEPDDRFASVEQQAEALAKIAIPASKLSDRTAIRAASAVGQTVPAPFDDTQAGLTHSGWSRSGAARGVWLKWAIGVAVIAVGLVALLRFNSHEQDSVAADPALAAVAPVLTNSEAPTLEPRASAGALESELSGPAEETVVKPREAGAEPAAVAERPSAIGGRATEVASASRTPSAESGRTTSLPVARPARPAPAVRPKKKPPKIADELGY